MEEIVYLTLQNGQSFQGKRFGATGEIVGEIVFATAMTGYLETLTDPSYHGQIVIQTFPLIGNYGVISDDFESLKPSVSAYIVREHCGTPSNFRMESDLDSYLKQNNIIGIYGIDTRYLTKIVRESGVMAAKISAKPLESLEELQQFAIRNAIQAVTCKEVIVHGKGNAHKIAVWDFGSKNNIIAELVQRNCEVYQVPAFYTAEQILDLHIDGLMLTNGPGDPEENSTIIANLRKLINKVPIFGICMGHQLFALAMGGKTAKMKYGHRGVNQPVKDLKTGRVYISSQNHGYQVQSASIEKVGKLRFINANDNTCEGIDYPEYNAFTVQFHPEACSGPKDLAFLFDRFIDMVVQNKGGR